MLDCSRAGTYAIPSFKNTRRFSIRSGTRVQATWQSHRQLHFITVYFNRIAL